MSSKVERMLYSAVRLISNIFNVLIPGKLFASLLLVANERTKAALPRFRRGEVLELVENAVFRNQVRSEESFSVKTDDQQIIVLFVGRLVDLKMLDIVILAIASCQTSNIQLTVVGDGPSGKKWRELARRLLGDRVKFVGWVANDKIMEVYDAADIFVLPSVRECGGAVVLEAMARGLPVVAVDWGGPADYVDSKTGFLVRPESKDSMIKDFSRYIDVLSADCSLRKRLGNAAIEKIKDKFTWETKIEAILVAYNNVLQCRL
ncbi:MAG: glycosyltransferase family 4 protein, partial [Chlorobium sp.]|nr:glycosyltransferase family 4 protein [Chlorobium sp.]